MASRRQAEEVPSDNTYLVCPLTDDTIEAIRAEAYKSREKKTLAQERKAARLRKREIEKRDLKELRKQRKAGILLPDSGISLTDDFKEFREFAKVFNNPLRYTQFVRRELYYKLNRKQMQRVLAQYYGWEKWSEDPWGSYPKFCKWIGSTRDNEMAVWAVNETSMGRDYLVFGILENLFQLKCSEIAVKGLITHIGEGAASFLYVKSHTGWDDFSFHYPKEPLPVRLINERVSKVYPFDYSPPFSDWTFPLRVKKNGSVDIPERVPTFDEMEGFRAHFIDPLNYGPLTRYRFLVSGIYLWRVTLYELLIRCKAHPEIESLIGYKSTTKSSIADVTQKLAPKDSRLLNQNEWWKEINGVTEWFQKELAGKYPDKSLVYSETYEDKKVNEINTAQALLKAVGYWLEQPADQLIKEGLEGKLLPSLKIITESNLINTTVNESPQFAEFRKALRKAERKMKPTTRIKKADLREQIKGLRDIAGTKERVKPSEKELVKLVYKDLLDAKAPLSLDREDEDKDGDTYSLGDTVEDKREQESLEQIEKQELRNAINEKWSPRQRLVIQLTLEDESDRDIALALEGKFGKPSSEESVRKHRGRAQKIARQVRVEMESS